MSSKYKHNPNRYRSGLEVKMIKEVWRDVVGYENFYEVSNLGRVKRLEHVYDVAGRYDRKQSERVINQTLNKSGYMQVGLYKNKKLKVARVHRLVAEAFLCAPSDAIVQECVESGMNYIHVNHRDGDRTNNCFTNLEWSSPKRNCRHAYAMGLSSNKKGEDADWSKLTEKDIRYIDKLIDTTDLFQREIAEVMEVTQTTISAIKLRKIWKHLDKVDSYAET